MVVVPTEEELKKLSPEARLKKLREIEELRKKELEETRKQVESELAAAEELIKKTETELDEEEVLERLKEESKKKTGEVEEDLEERIAQEQVQQPPPEQYKTGPELYNALERATYELNRLYETESWTEQDRQAYQESKRQVEKVQTYMLTSDRLEEELGLASSVLHRLKYKH